METWPQGSRGLALWLRPSPSTLLPGRAPRAAGWSPLDHTQVMWPGTQSLCPRPSADSPCNDPLPADLGCGQEAGKLFSLRDIVQHGTVSVKAGWPDEQGSRMGEGGGPSTEGQHPTDRWETEAWGDQCRDFHPQQAFQPCLASCFPGEGAAGKKAGTTFQRRM